MAGVTERMRAVVLDRYGPPEVLRLEEVERPVPAAGEVLVRVRAATVNRNDCAWRRAHPFFQRLLLLAPSKGRMLGDEFAGTVAEVGSDVTGSEVGDEVFGVRAYLDEGFGCHVELMNSLSATKVFDYMRHDPTETGQSCDAILDAVGKLSFLRLRHGSRRAARSDPPAVSSTSRWCRSPSAPAAAAPSSRPPRSRSRTCGSLPSSMESDAVTFFAEHGVRVERVMTDNAMTYTQSRQLAAFFAAMGIRHLRTRPRRPQTKGKAERFIGTLQREWAYARLFRSNAERLASLPRWLDTYNRRRPHAGLGGLTPLTVLVNKVEGNDN